MNNRTDIVYESLTGYGLDKNIFNVVSNITAEEWLQLISQKDTKGGSDKYLKLIPYLIHSYDEEKIMEMIQKSSFPTVSYALVDAWFSAIYGETMVADLQPTFNDITRKPSLLYIFEGHLLRVIESAEYEEDISSFITTKFKMMLREYTSVLTSKNGQSEGLKLLIGATTGTSVYPPLTDYSLDRLESVNNFVCFLSAIDMCVGSFEAKGAINAYDQELISSGQFELLIERNTNSRKQQYSNQNQFNEAFEYVMQNFERHVERFSGFMFTDYEKELLAYVFKAKGLNVATEEVQYEQSAEPTEGMDDLQLNPLAGVENDLHDNVLNLSDAATEERSSKREGNGFDASKLIAKVKCFFTSEKTEVVGESDTQAKPVQQPTVAQAAPQNEDAGYSDILITGKKKNNNALWFIGIGLVAAISALTLIGNGMGTEKESIIDKTQNQSGEGNVSQYKTIKVIEK